MDEEITGRSIGAELTSTEERRIRRNARRRRQDSRQRYHPERDRHSNGRQEPGHVSDRTSNPREGSRGPRRRRKRGLPGFAVDGSGRSRNLTSNPVRYRSSESSPSGKAPNSGGHESTALRPEPQTPYISGCTCQAWERGLAREYRTTVASGGGSSATHSSVSSTEYKMREINVI